MRLTPPAAAYDRLSPMLADRDQCEALLDALNQHPGPIDPRWFVAVAPLLGGHQDIRAAYVFGDHPMPEAFRALERELAKHVDDKADVPVGFYEAIDRLALRAESAPLWGRIPALLVRAAQKAGKHTDYRLTRPLGLLETIGAGLVVEQLREAAAAATGKAKRAFEALLPRNLVAPAEPRAKPRADRDLELRTRLEAAGLAEDRVDEVLAHVRTRIDLAPRKAQDAALGTTRFGGMPDLPKGIDWPHHTCSEATLGKQLVLSPTDYKAGTFPAAVKSKVHVPLSFIAQVALDELAPHDIDRVVKATGMLWFFARPEIHVDTRGDLPHLACAVIHAAKPGKLARAKPPATLPTSAQYAPATVTISHTRSIPPFNVAPISGLGLVDSERAHYERAMRADEHGATPHAALGWARAAYFLGLPGARQELLLRVGSESASGFSFGDADPMFFLIKRADLARNHFGAAWCVIDE